jgi:glycosyltransferase involved in cell wall biosynthesis
MNILIFNIYNPLIESGIVALDLFNQLKSSDHEVKMLVNRYDKNYPEGIISMESSLSSSLRKLIYKFEWRFNKIKQILKLKGKYQRDTDYRFFQLDEKKQIYKTDSFLKIVDVKPDIIIILFAKGFINVKNIYELYIKTNAKIFWLMFDMAPFTGGCHYAWDCKGYQESCGNCPGLFSSDPFDISYDNLIYKKAFLDRIDIQILAGSEWHYKQAKMSTLFKNKPIHKILLSIDSTVFKPVDKGELKMAMKITANKKIIFFGAIGLTEKRKGMRYLIESLNKLKEIIKSADSDLGNNIILLVAGGDFDEIADLLPFESKYLGYLDNSYGIASAYQVSDVFLCPSIEDSGPMMINQSIMSGTPVVSFEMGVSLDLVITGETGYRARIKDSSDMAQGIFNILKLNSNDYNRLSVRCRDLAMKLYSAEARIKLLESLIKNAGSN